MAYYCLINHARKFIACVDPKCGSNTVRDWFNHTLPEPRKPPYGNFKPYMIPAKTVGDYADYTRIFFVRDPLRRLVSFYYQWVVQDEELWCFADADRRVGLRGRTFSEFLRILEVLARRGVRFQHHLEPQTRVLGAVEVDEVVKLEELDERIVAINAALGVGYTPRRLHAHAYGAPTASAPFELHPAALREETPFFPESFFDAELEGLARSIYADDVRYYESH